MLCSVAAKKFIGPSGRYKLSQFVSQIMSDQQVWKLLLIHQMKLPASQKPSVFNSIDKEQFSLKNAGEIKCCVLWKYRERNVYINYGTCPYLASKFQNTRNKLDSSWVYTCNLFYNLPNYMSRLMDYLLTVFDVKFLVSFVLQKS